MKYQPLRDHFDELYTNEGNAQSGAKTLSSILNSMNKRDLMNRERACENLIKNLGISFTVYSKGSTTDRSWPLDVIPRVIAQKEWARVEKGLKQRLRALNLFIHDLYHKQKVIKDGVFPKELIHSSQNFRKVCRGVVPPKKIWAHICGSDLVRDKDGNFYVLEDNLRIPSGVSYVLENRAVMKQVFPEIFQKRDILAVDDYPAALLQMLKSVKPRSVRQPEMVVLTPGVFNSAYFEHSYLARSMGMELVEGRDLYVDRDDCVYMKTVSGPARVHVIYRRIDDEFVDPECFRKDSALGVRGLIRSWKKGKVTLVNAPGAGVADDKVVYSYVPEIVRYYLGEDPIIPNVPTYICNREKDLKYVLENLKSLVVKPANASGGYGIFIGPKSTKADQAKVARAVRANPRNFIAQPVVRLSTAPTLCKAGVEPRHLDLRPFILQGANRLYCTSGGLTRVALRRGSIVVNSSQGGGSKDTWVVRD